MIIAYCSVCLPAKVVLAYGHRHVEVNVQHEGHPYTEKNGLFPIPFNDWKNIYVEGDDVQTKANIVANYPDQFV